MKILLILLLLLNMSLYAKEHTSCKEAYFQLNKHNKRASMFINNTDWEMAKYYIEKIKHDYNYFYSNECFQVVFPRDNIERMKEKYKNSLKQIKGLSEMINETIKEKNRIEKEKLLTTLEEKKRLEKERLREEILEEMNLAQ